MVFLFLYMLLQIGTAAVHQIKTWNPYIYKFTSAWGQGFPKYHIRRYISCPRLESPPPPPPSSTKAITLIPEGLHECNKEQGANLQHWELILTFRYRTQLCMIIQRTKVNQCYNFYLGILFDFVYIHDYCLNTFSWIWKLSFLAAELVWMMKLIICFLWNAGAER